MSTTPSLRDRDALQAYLSQIRRAERLDADQQMAMAKRYAATGDPAAKQALVNGNLRLVVKAAFRAGGRNGEQVLDLIQEGNIGLIRAVDKFDAERGVPFAAYATYWIRATMYRYLMNKSRGTKLGTTRNGRKLFFQLEKERRRLRTADHEPTLRELSEALDVPEEEVASFQRLLRHPVSIDQPTEDGRSYTDVLSDESAVDPEDEAARGQLRDRVRVEIDRFSLTLRDQRETDIWNERLLADAPTTLAELGDRYGVSKERIRQVETRLKKRFRSHLDTSMGDQVRVALAA